MKNKLRENIEREAAERLSNFTGKVRKVSNYEGGSDNYEGGNEDNYIGANDDHLDFQGSGNSYLGENSGTVNFAFSITNAAAATKQIALTPTYLGTAAALATATGETVDGVLTDGTIITNVTGTAGNSKLTIAGLQNFIRNNPSKLTRMTIVSNDTSSFETNIIYQDLSAFRTLQNNRIPLTKYVDPNQFNTKKAVVPFYLDYPEFQLDDQKLIIFSIGGTNVVATTGVTLNFTLEFGVVLNQAKTLAKKSMRAHRVMTNMALAKQR